MPSLPMPLFALLFILLFSLTGCSTSRPEKQNPPPEEKKETTGETDKNKNAEASTTAQTQDAQVFPVMLGIDVLEEQGFAILKGKRVGLLTHRAGVNRKGEPSIDVLRRAKDVKLVALYAVEHGLRGDLPAEKTYPDQPDPRTGLMVYSLYNGKSRMATAAQLKAIDVLVVDLQDIGTRSYTYVSAMRLAMEACFKAGKEVVVLDRPNPLGGLKVDGPLLDAQWTSYVGAFRVPYVHGLTIGELARMAKEAPGVLEIAPELREKGKLTVIPMKGWRRNMHWPETGLKWVPTSPKIQDYEAVLGYPMTGLGCYLGGFKHGVGDQHWFRGVSHLTLKSELVERELKAFNIPGIQFKRIGVTNGDGKPGTGIYVQISDFDAWHPTELSFYLMKLACKYEPQNPFSAARKGIANGFLRHMGSTTFFEALKKEGGKVDVAAFMKDCQAKCSIYQQQVKKYWLYPEPPPPSPKPQNAS